MVNTQAGEAYSDVAGIAALLASVALLVNVGPGRDRLAGLGVAALAGGIAVGTKFTFLLAVAVLSIGVVTLAPRGERLRQGCLWLVLVGVGGGFWYVRNLLTVGNPVPWVEVNIGPLHLPSPPVRSRVSTVASYAFDGRVWDEYFLPGFDFFFGRAWLPVVMLGVGGLVLALVTGPTGRTRTIALSGLAVVAAFVFAPQNLELAPGEPFIFSSNLRYLAPAIVLGLVLLALIPLLARRSSWVLAGFGMVLAATQFDRKLWPVDPSAFSSVRLVDTLAGVGLGATVFVAGALLLARRRPTAGPSMRAAVGIAVLIALAGFPLQAAYLRDRYSETRVQSPLYTWGQAAQDERIALVGEVRQYPLYGKDLSNHVQYVGHEGPHRGFAPIRDCAEWRLALNAGSYSYVVVAPEGIPLSFGPPPELAWTETDPAARLVLRDDTTSLYRLAGRMNPAACPSS
jgi:hypothetical protein